MRIGSILLASLILAACGGGTRGDAGPRQGGDAGDAGIPPGDAGLDGGGSDAAALDAGVVAPTVTLRIVATGDPFAHADLLAGQTARATQAGVRSLALYRSMTDPDPLVLFRAEGPDAVVGYVPGDDTTLAVLAASALESGTYAFGRLVQTYARYEVDATMHRLDGTYDGVAHSFQVIADGTDVGGVVYDAGHYEVSFSATGATGGWSGEDALFPDYSATPGAVGVVEGGEWAVYFPIDLEITETPTADATLTLDVNMHEAFRWTDLLLLGYELGVFDVTDLSFEPVVRFGGNSFELTLTSP